VFPRAIPPVVKIIVLGVLITVAALVIGGLGVINHFCASGGCQ